MNRGALPMRQMRRRDLPVWEWSTNRWNNSEGIKELLANRGRKLTFLRSHTKADSQQDDDFHD